MSTRDWRTEQRDALRRRPHALDLGVGDVSIPQLPPNKQPPPPKAIPSLQGVITPAFEQPIPPSRRNILPIQRWPLSSTNHEEIIQHVMRCHGVADAHPPIVSHYLKRFSLDDDERDMLANEACNRIRAMAKSAAVDIARSSGARLARDVCRAGGDYSAEASREISESFHDAGCSPIEAYRETIAIFSAAQENRKRIDAATQAVSMHDIAHVVEIQACPEVNETQQETIDRLVGREGFSSALAVAEASRRHTVADEIVLSVRGREAARRENARLLSEGTPQQAVTLRMRDEGWAPVAQQSNSMAEYSAHSRAFVMSQQAAAQKAHNAYLREFRRVNGFDPTSPPAHIVRMR